MKLNIGCGNKILADYHSIDIKPLDAENYSAWDLNIISWKIKGEIIPDNSVEELLAIHVMEHLGRTTEEYFNIWKEIYRIMKPSGIIKIIVPHPMHDNFRNDPTHIRPITPSGLSMFSKKFNRHCIANNFSNSTFGLDLDIDFEIINTEEVIEERFKNYPDINFAKKAFNNVISEYIITIKKV